MDLLMDMENLFLLIMIFMKEIIYIILKIEKEIMFLKMEILLMEHGKIFLKKESLE